MLQQSSEVAGIAEAAVLKHLDATPFEEMKCHDLITKATASFLVGETNIREYMNGVFQEMDNLDFETAATTLRFATHLALYLDSLASSTSPVVLENIQECKNELLRRYVRFLEAHDDLWHLVVLYSSMMPTGDLMQYLPLFLTTIETEKQRETIIRQLHEFLPEPTMDQEVLKEVVQLVLGEEDDSEDTQEVTKTDARKMKAVQWLCLEKERYAGDAVITANQLLRQFLLAEKFCSAIAFVDTLFPAQLLDEVARQVETDQSEHRHDASVALSRVIRQDRYKNAYSELLAFRAYLDAITEYEKWIVVSTENSPEDTSGSGGGGDRSKLNNTEASIADQMDRRQIVEEKRDSSALIVEAAHRAQNTLHAVLTHPGGWLLTDDEMTSNSGDAESERRKDELIQLRAKLLPQVVHLYQEVCLQAADWLTRSSQHAAMLLGMTVSDTIDLLDDSKQGTASPISPHHWHSQCLDIAKLVVSDQYRISKVFVGNELNEMFEKLARAATGKLI